VPKTLAATEQLDLLTIHSPLLAASFFVRDLPRRVTRKPAPPTPERLSFTDERGLPGWARLTIEPDREIVIGAVGVFWTPTISWNEHVTPATFADFAEPGWGKIACSFTTLAYGTGRTLLTYERRTLTTDPASRQRFMRYWWIIRPFVRHIMSATVGKIGADAARLTAARPGVSEEDPAPVRR